VQEIESGKLSSENFTQVKLHPKAEDPWALDWLFVVDTLNFCFWSLEDEVGWTVDGYTGYFALCAAINRALKVCLKNYTDRSLLYFFFLTIFRKKWTF
jgi:hypothetical protein